MSHMLGTDLETTGLGKRASTTEIALVHYNGEERLSQLVLRVKPDDDAAVSLTALRITKQTMKSLNENALSRKEAALAIVDYLCNTVFPITGNKKIRWVGHNVYGDVARIRELLEEFNFVDWNEVFDYHLLDTAPMASLLRDAGHLTMDKLSLKTLAEALQIDLDKFILHGALADIDVTFLCYFKMLKLLRGLYGKKDT